MTRSQASSVEAYLAGLPEGRRETLGRVRRLILEHLPEGYVEGMGFGRISYQVPLEEYPDTYNGEPLSYVALASEERHCSLYLMSVYQDPDLRERLEEAFAAAGKELDMGKSCLRFRSVEDLALDAIADLVASTPPEAFIESYERARKR